MGRNYPSEDLVGLTSDVKFFSNKTLQTGLQNLRVEFCRTTYIGKAVELSTNKIYRDLLTKDGPYSLEKLELPPRQFVTFELRRFST